MPTLIVVVTVQVVQRWMNFAIANPGAPTLLHSRNAGGEIQGEELH